MRARKREKDGVRQGKPSMTRSCLKPPIGRQSSVCAVRMGSKEVRAWVARGLLGPHKVSCASPRSAHQTMYACTHVRMRARKVPFELLEEEPGSAGRRAQRLRGGPPPRWPASEPCERNARNRRRFSRSSFPPRLVRRKSGLASALDLGAELFAKSVVPVVGDLAYGFEEVLELFIVEARNPPNRSQVDFVLLSVDREGSVARR